MLYEAFIAKRYLLSRERGALVAIITLISILGVAIGVCALMVVISVMDGADVDLFARMIQISAHVRLVAPEGEAFPNYNEICAVITKVKGVKAVAPAVEEQAIALHRSPVTNNLSTVGILIDGIDPKRELNVTGINKNTEPKNLGTPGKGQIVLGKPLAQDQLGVFPGDSIRLMTKLDNIAGTMRPKQVDLKVIGYLNSGYYQFDQQAAYVNMQQAQDMFLLGDVANQIRIAVDYPASLSQSQNKELQASSPTAWQRFSDAVQQYFRPADYNPNIRRDIINAALSIDDPPIPPRTSIITWVDWNGDFLKALNLEKFAMWIILMLVILVAAFNIIGTQVLVVMQKTREVGILMSMGVPRRSIRRVFWGFGLAIGVAGTLAGLAGGFGICYLIAHTDLIKLPPAVYGIDHLPVKIEPLTISLIVIFSMGICMLASVFPAWRASQLDPVEALRYE